MALEKPPDGVRRAALLWIFSRMEDPYQGVRRQDGFENLWFGHIPGTWDESGQWAVCSYWIFEDRRGVRCDNFGTLSGPFSP